MKKKLPVGIQNFNKLRMGNYYTVDKSLMIKEFLDQGSDVTLITRPRRFGKTLNMSMMSEFFDVRKDSKEIFDGLSIMDTEYASQINTKPVLFISFLSVKGEKKEDFLTKYFNTLNDTYSKYDYLFLEENSIKDALREELLTIYAVLKKSSNVSDEMQRVAYQALPKLIEAMRTVHGEGVYLFIDEYTPARLKA